MKTASEQDRDRSVSAVSVRRRAVVAASIAVDHDATAVANDTEPRFHGSSVSGIDHEDLRVRACFTNQAPA